MTPIVIAVDGPAASGKGTLASVIAADYGLPFLDTGLLYRAIGHLAHHQKVSHAEREALAALAPRIDAELLAHDALRGREAGERASLVAAIPEVRAALKQYQIDFAHQPSGAVLDGRDIGTVIAPNAAVKLFVTAALGDDFSFVHTSWQKGIENWRFQLPGGNLYSDRFGATVFDRTLFRAGEKVRMKHYFRRHTMQGFGKPAHFPEKLEIRHQDSPALLREVQQALRKLGLPTRARLQALQ